ncbi:DUF6545 domain-containing protein [Streptomyces sioyaensis]|uniref:DUF6545 domain-containing protein n=1 Tax=Streptomyces sioyaensis TaxID=67364 RepID=UPI0037D9570A
MCDGAFPRRTSSAFHRTISRGRLQTNTTCGCTTASPAPALRQQTGSRAPGPRYTANGRRVGLGPASNGAVQQEAAAGVVASRGATDTPEGNAEVEAAIPSAAVTAKRAGAVPDGDEVPAAVGTHSRKGDLQAETSWLLLVTHAYTHHKSQEVAVAETSDVSAWSGS